MRVQSRETMVGVAVWILAIAASAGAAPLKGSAPGPSVAYRAAILVDADSGAVLHEENSHVQAPPASMTKMMLMLLVAERVAARQLHWDDPVVTSTRASRMGGSQVYLKDGEVFSLGEMMQAIVIHSANDAAVAVAERVAGSVEAFVTLMNERASQLGMRDTTYRSVHGLPPEAGQEPDLSSAHDMALVARGLVKHEPIVGWSSTREAPFRNGAMTLTNTNRLVRETTWVDGLKTGYYREAGFNVTATARRDGMRLIAVVMGAPVKRDCFASAQRLLNRGFSDYHAQIAVRQDEVIASDVRVPGGRPRLVRVIAGEALTVVAKRKEKRSLTLELALQPALQPPIDAKTRVGEVVVKEGETVLGRVPALVAEAVRPASLWERIF